jgi:hypothetical protein
MACIATDEAVLQANHQLDIFPLHEAHCFERVAQNGLGRLGAVGHPGGVSEIDHRLAGQRPLHLLEDGQTPDPRIEDSDGAPVHAPLAYSPAEAMIDPIMSE